MENHEQVTIFETHVTVRNLERAMQFYSRLPGLEQAFTVPERGVAFYWVGARGRQMLGVWETGSAPVQVRGHFAFGVSKDAVLAAPAWLRARGIAPRGFDGQPSDEPQVLAWMPAVAVYFEDPDGNLLEYLAMLDDPPAPDRGVVPWSEW